MLKNIYMDYAASTPTKKVVLDSFVDSLKDYANPSSSHEYGRNAKSLIDNASNRIANVIHCKPNELYYTSGATMSNNLFIQGFLKNNPNAIFITTAIEHNDILMIYNSLTRAKYMLWIRKDGTVDLNEIRFLLHNIYEENKNSVVLFAIQMANSESGAVQPIETFSNIIKQYPHAYLYVDATQYIPYYPINVEKLGIDGLGMSGQKIGGIKGSGLLYIKESVQGMVAPIIYGEQGLVGGTYPTPLILSLATAFENIDYNIDDLESKRNYFVRRLFELGGQLIGGLSSRLPNNIYIRFPGIDGQTMVNLLSNHGIFISTGSACSSDSTEPSRVALAYGLQKKEALEVIRITIGENTTIADINTCITVIQGLIKTLLGGAKA